MKSQVDHCVYGNKVSNHFMYVIMNVDDMLLVENNMDIIREVKQQLSSEFDMKDVNATNFMLQIEIKRDQADIRPG